MFSGPTGFSFKMTYHTRKISSPHCFLFLPLVANQDSILMTSLYSLCFLSPCPTHAFFFFFFLCISFWQELKHKKCLDQDETSGGACWAVQCFVLSSGGEEGEVRGDGMSFPRWGPCQRCSCFGKQRAIFEVIPGLTLCHLTSAVQGNTKVLDLKRGSVVLRGLGDLNGLKPKSAVVTKR